MACGWRLSFFLFLSFSGIQGVLVHTIDGYSILTGAKCRPVTGVKPYEKARAYSWGLSMKLGTLSCYQKCIMYVRCFINACGLAGRCLSFHSLLTRSIARISVYRATKPLLPPTYCHPRPTLSILPHAPIGSLSSNIRHDLSILPHPLQSFPHLPQSHPLPSPLVKVALIQPLLKRLPSNTIPFPLINQHTPPPRIPPPSLDDQMPSKHPFVHESKTQCGIPRNGV